jgi:chromosomal replication initiator protein
MFGMQSVEGSEPTLVRLKTTESSPNTIGEAFGGRDHGTVLRACRLVQDRMQVDSQVRQTVTHLEKQLLR